MANEQNLRPSEYKLTQDEAKKGGINSGKARRRKADIRKAAQAVIDDTYKDKATGKEVTGAEALVIKLFQIANDPKNKQCIQAMRLLLELSGQDKTAEDKKKAKAEIDILQAKAKLLKGGEVASLNKLDEILKGLEGNANAETHQNAE